MKTAVLTLLLFSCTGAIALPLQPVSPRHNVLIVVEGQTSLRNVAMGDGRQLATLMGHFQTTTRLIGVRDYRRAELDACDILFYIGFHAENPLPAEFLDDVLATAKPVVWINTGFREFSRLPGVKRKWGFTVGRLDSTDNFETVKSGGNVFRKGEPNLNLIEIADRRAVAVIATAVAQVTQREVPYIVQSGNLIYVGDSPFASAGDSDRYLLFADMLHDILGQPHEETHSALLRIEDISPMDNPARLREIADILSSRGIPFLVGVIPFYVSPAEGIRVSLSDKPELVDALKYMVQNGATIVMHGVTHQYKGVTAMDYEFWDESTNAPIRGETVEGIRQKLQLGIEECMRNGIYPLLWETPHYTASFRLYQTVPEFFGAAMEQRLSIEDADYGQTFPYVIDRDLFGQKIYPEDLGYIPLEPTKEKSEADVRALLANAKTMLTVRDGFASSFFHEFLDLDLLVQIVEGVQALGYTYIDLREQPLWVKTPDRVILTGDQSYTVTLHDQFLAEAWFARNGEIERKQVSAERFDGPVTRHVTLGPGEFYRAEPAEFRERTPGALETASLYARNLFHRVFGSPETWSEARPVILWNHFAVGSAYNDQASFAAVFRSVNIDLDTLFLGQPLDFRKYNLLVVPYGFVDSLRETDYDVIMRFVEGGGCLITDGKNDLAENFGIRYSAVHLNVARVRDRLFPEELIRWTRPEVMTKFDVDDVDRIFCIHEVTETPLVIGKRWEKGKVIYFGTRFDPLSQEGTSRYPYLLEYVRSYFQLGPSLRREQLAMYFEPGMRRNTSVETLVSQWVKEGIRCVHVSGWHEYPKYTYDYERLIRLAHANGILVYAWLEPPQVSQKFWNEHPAWREKNYLGKDVVPSWRYPVAMTDSACLDAMTAAYRTLLQSYDWDGVNLGEVYFESGRGLDDPQLFTPMHPSARQEFRRRYGYDLASVLEPASPHYWKTDSAAAGEVTAFRVSALDRVYRRLLPMMQEIARAKPGCEIIVTAMDSYGAPELKGYFGVDMKSILRLQKEFGFALQVEDPERLWSTDPDRYESIGSTYAALVGDSSKLLLDLNI
ncbi:MAG TPA: polysaccharide deacetylase family protein, partial [Bacteroidota bacterium]|nr:polysaccharide deacetylase family protein [Bacteroidota bacterium]